PKHQMNTSTSFSGIFNPMSQMNVTSMLNYGGNQYSRATIANTSGLNLNRNAPIINASVPIVNSSGLNLNRNAPIINASVPIVNSSGLNLNRNAPIINASVPIVNPSGLNHNV